MMNNREITTMPSITYSNGMFVDPQKNMAILMKEAYAI